MILVGLGFPILRDPNILGTHGVFLMFSVLCFIAGIFIFMCVKETQGKTAIEIQKMYSDEPEDDRLLTQDE
jgi:hypothetical protein